MPRSLPTNKDFQRALREVLEILEPLAPGSQAQFMLNPRGSLGGRRPLEALALGMFEEVKKSAEGFVEI